MVRIRLALMMAVLPIATGLAQQQHRGMKVAPDVAVRVYNLVGRIRVTGWDRDSIDVTAIIPRGGGALFGGGAQALDLANPISSEMTSSIWD